MSFLFPDAILYGMTSNEFWNEDPELFWSYRLFYEQKEKNEDFKQWKQGYYIFNAVEISLYNNFTDFKKTGTRPSSYAHVVQPLLEQSVKTKEEIVKEQIQAREEKIKERLANAKRTLERKKKDGR